MENIEKLDKLGRSELHYAANDKDFQKVRNLINLGFDINLKDKNGLTPLHFAAQSQSFEIVELLLNSGSIVDLFDNYGNTPLFKAVLNYRNDGSIIELLRKKGADPYIKNNSGQSPLGLARLIVNFDVSKFFSDLP